MPLTHDQRDILTSFSKTADLSRGAVILDLDGTALWEEHGVAFISGAVEEGVKNVHDFGIPTVFNTLRFPLSVIRTVCPEWMKFSGDRIPSIHLAGSQTGHIVKRGQEIVFEELESFPLLEHDIEEAVTGVSEIMENDIRHIAVFFYPRDWRRGEVIWTPEPHRIDELAVRYKSASEIVAGDIHDLRDRIISSEPVMMYVLVHAGEDQLMMYQHKNPNTFITRPGVNKAYGTRHLAKKLGFSLLDSVGAGNTSMDTFLTEVGLSVHVGDGELPFQGKSHTLKLGAPIDLGESLSELASMSHRIKKK